MAELVIAFTDSSAFQRTWKITTKQVSNVILYDLETMPEISEDTAVKVQDNRMIVNLKGTETGKYNKVLFTAVPKDETKESVLLYQLKTPVGEGEISFDLPYDLESGIIPCGLRHRMMRVIIIPLWIRIFPMRIRTSRSSRRK